MTFMIFIWFKIILIIFSWSNPGTDIDTSNKKSHISYSCLQDVSCLPCAVFASSQGVVCLKLLLLLAQLQRMKPLCFVILNCRTEHWNLGSASTSYLQELALHTVAEARHYYDLNLTVKLQHVDHQHVVANQGLLFWPWITLCGFQELPNCQSFLPAGRCVW